jgi:hypothetical protein
MTANEETSRLRTVRVKWGHVVPSRACWFRVEHNLRGRSKLMAELRELPPGTPVVLCDTWPFSASRCRNLASRGGVCVVRSYLALPTLAKAVALVQDEPETARYAARALLVAPMNPSMRARVQRHVVPLAATLLSTDLRSAVFGSRLVVGTRV